MGRGIIAAVVIFRRETIIALRARRKALQIARDVAYPHMPPPPKRTILRWVGVAYPVYEAVVERVVFYVEEFAPVAWMKWFALGCVIAIAAAAFFILKIVR